MGRNTNLFFFFFSRKNIVRALLLNDWPIAVFLFVIFSFKVIRGDKGKGFKGCYFNLLTLYFLIKHKLHCPPQSSQKHSSFSLSYPMIKKGQKEEKHCGSHWGIFSPKKTHGGPKPTWIFMILCPLLYNGSLLNFVGSLESSDFGVSVRNWIPLERNSVYWLVEFPYHKIIFHILKVYIIKQIFIVWNWLRHPNGWGGEVSDCFVGLGVPYLSETMSLLCLIVMWARSRFFKPTQFIFSFTCCGKECCSWPLLRRPKAPNDIIG